MMKEVSRILGKDLSFEEFKSLVSRSKVSERIEALKPCTEEEFGDGIVAILREYM